MSSIRPLAAADHAGLAALLEEMQAYYRAACPNAESILDGLRNIPSGVEILVADAGAIVGFAAFAAIYPGPGLAAGFFLKELFVSAPFRSSGIGRRLLQGVAQIAVERGYGRVDWTADGKNLQLLAYYEGLGASPMAEKVFFRLEGEALTSLGDSGRS